MKAEFYWAASVSGSWYCSCWLLLTLPCLTGTIEWNWATVMLLVTPKITCGFPTIISERMSADYISSELRCNWYWSSYLTDSKANTQAFFLKMCECSFNCLYPSPLHWHCVISMQCCMLYCHCRWTTSSSHCHQTSHPSSCVMSKVSP